MHMHDTLARGQDGIGRILFTHLLAYKKMLVTRGLPVLDYTARSSSEPSEEAYITEADHMIWDLSGYFAQQQYCGP